MKASSPRASLAVELQLGARAAEQEVSPFAIDSRAFSSQ